MSKFDDAMLDRVHDAYQAEFGRWGWRFQARYRSSDPLCFEIIRDAREAQIIAVRGGDPLHSEEVEVVLVGRGDRTEAEAWFGTLRGRAAAEHALLGRAGQGRGK